MFRTVPLSIIRSFSLYTQQWYMWYIFPDILRAVWWTEELSETCKVLFQNKLEKLFHLGSFVIRIYHDARSSERQIRTWWMFVTCEVLMLVSNCIKVFWITTPCNLLPSCNTTRCHIRDVCFHDLSHVPCTIIDIRITVNHNKFY